MSAVPHNRVPLQELVLIPELSPRSRMCEETIIRYMESFSSLPPVRVQKGTNVVIDGYHRVEAAVRLGLEAVPVELEPIADGDLKMAAGVANVSHGQPLTRAERNALAVSLVRNYAKLREEVAGMLGMSASAVTLALREHQFNEQLSEKLGTPVQVINSAHVRALYRVGPEQRERLLEAVVSKLDDDGQPYPLTCAELKLLVNRMLDPASPTAELNRLLGDPKARPKPTAGGPAPEANGHLAADPFMPEAGSDTRPWEREWESPLKAGDGDAFDRVRGIDEEIERAGGGGAQAAARGRQIEDLLERAEANVREQTLAASGDYHASRGSYEEPEPTAEARLKEQVAAAVKALEDLLAEIEPRDVRWQVETVVGLLQSLL